MLSNNYIIQKVTLEDCNTSKIMIFYCGFKERLSNQTFQIVKTSEQSNMIRGQIIVIDGGVSLTTVSPTIKTDQGDNIDRQ